MEKKQNKNIMANLGKATLLLVALFLFIYFIAILSGSSDFFSESAEKNSLLYFEQSLEDTDGLVRVHYENLYKIADRLKYAKSKQQVEETVESYIGSEEFGDLRYYSQGNSYSATSRPVFNEASGKEYIEALAASNSEGCTPVYYDKYTSLDCIAFFVPIRGSEFVDGILSIVPARNVINLSTIENEKASVTAAITPDGKVLSDACREDFSESVGNNFYSFIDTITSNKTTSREISEAVYTLQKTARSIEVHSEKYTVTMAPIESFDGNVILVSMSISEGLIAPELTYIRHVVNLLVIAILALVAGFAYAFLYHKKTKLALSVATLVDAQLDCPNLENFKLTAKSLLFSMRRKYSVAVFSVRNNIYLRDQLGEGDFTEFLRSVSKIVQSLTSDDECYGYLGDGKFVILTINANSHSVADKIKLMETLINRDELLRDKGVKIRLMAGVYNVVSNNRRSVQEMLDCALTAYNYSEDNVNTAYSLFTEEVRAEIERNERIEAMMEDALANRDFRLFLQPKYDVKRDTVHSAEALVRWFDSSRGEYMFPAEFIPFFETNGFITKIDHFVYIEVLEYLSHAVERGEKVVPISVNVSRVTAISPDFINFYVGNKKRYGIPDGFLTLELTESFAMESYEKISSIISALHNGGIRCSIDDFGSGYSSFSILKQINVDELKLDSVFMKRGIDVRRDDKLLATVIDLAKSMGMTVVQEGVETKELFDKVVDMGCDVVQGYYYAKAIAVEEFKVFIKTNTSIKYKSLVK